MGSRKRSAVQGEPPKPSRRTLVAGAFFVTMLLLATLTALAWGVANNPQGKTTVTQRIVPASNGSGFRQLTVGPGEAYTSRR